jgi:ADP-ribose pyrophosphatase
MTTKRNIVLETEWFSIEVLESRPEWNVGDRPYFRMLSPDSVAVLPITADGKILVVRQFRPARSKTTIEIPAGGIEDDETPLEAAHRELLEETGHAAESVFFLGRGGLNLSRESAWVHAYVAFGVRPQVDAVGRDQGIEIIALSFAEFNSIVQAGSFEQLSALGVVAMAKAKFPDVLSSLLS